jgi:(2Fe-2S) ferredoxin
LHPQNPKSKIRNLMSEHLAATNEPSCILICQHLTCRKQGAAKVLAAFKATPTPELKIEGCGCLGRCGSGPNAIVLPARIWYHRLRLEDLPDIVAACTAATEDRSVDLQ